MKQITLILFLLCAPFSLALADVYTETAMKTIATCYDVENKVGVDLAKCVADKMKSYANPLDYKVNIQMDNLTKATSGTITILMYNKNGYRISCTGTASQTISITQCLSGQGQPLTKGQDLSISPP